MSRNYLLTSEYTDATEPVVDVTAHVRKHNPRLYEYLIRERQERHVRRDAIRADRRRLEGKR